LHSPFETTKENRSDIRNSKAADPVRELEHWWMELAVSDPWANPERVRRKFGLTLGTSDTVHPVATN
jgi:UDP-N-acetyl-D-galactosamine dehydrogenase